MRFGRGGVLLEACATPADLGRDGAFRVGFTASRKVGGAVERNRAKRRLRALAEAILPASARNRTDYVLIARPSTLTRPFALLLDDLAAAVQTAHLKLDDG